MCQKCPVYVGFGVYTVNPSADLSAVLSGAFAVLGAVKCQKTALNQQQQPENISRCKPWAVVRCPRGVSSVLPAPLPLLRPPWGDRVATQLSNN